ARAAHITCCAVCRRTVGERTPTIDDRRREFGPVGASQDDLGGTRATAQIREDRPSRRRLATGRADLGWDWPRGARGPRSETGAGNRKNAFLEVSTTPKSLIVCLWRDFSLAGRSWLSYTAEPVGSSVEGCHHCPGGGTYPSRSRQADHLQLPPTHHWAGAGNCCSARTTRRKRSSCSG